MNRKFLMLAKVFDAKKHGIGGWFMSEKLDGQRAFWDGGITRGMPKTEIPWANNDKDDRLLEEQISTGLWSRLGNVIHAPGWWLDKLPPIMLDGELWHGVRGYGERQNLRRIVGRHSANDGWRRVKYYVFDMPPPRNVFLDGRINETHFKKVFKDLREWGNREMLDFEPRGFFHFRKAVKRMEDMLDDDIAVCWPQIQLPYQTDKALTIIQNELERVCDMEGEGLVLRKPESIWYPKRVTEVLKVKKLDDDEATVTGYITGRRTDKGSKLLGMMGALILDYKGKRLELSGFTDEERRLSMVAGAKGSSTPQQWAEDHPGQEVPSWIESANFPRGSSITFRYSGTSLDGIPTEARYWRKGDVS